MLLVARAVNGWTWAQLNLHFRDLKFHLALNRAGGGRKAWPDDKTSAYLFQSELITATLEIASGTPQRGPEWRMGNCKCMASLSVSQTGHCRTTAAGLGCFKAPPPAPINLDTVHDGRIGEAKQDVIDQDGERAPDQASLEKAGTGADDRDELR